MVRMDEYENKAKKLEENGIYPQAQQKPIRFQEKIRLEECFRSTFSQVRTNFPGNCPRDFWCDSEQRFDSSASVSSL